MRFDRITALHAFRLIAAHGSFTRAAAELDITPSALSQMLRQLEQRLNVRLLNRTTRRVGLTEAGRSFLDRIAPALAEIEAAEEGVRQSGERPAGTLRLTVPSTACALLLEPLLGEFMRAYPKVRLDITLDDGFADLVRENFDAGIRLGESLQLDMVAVPIGGAQRSVVVGSPAYFASHGKPRHPRERATHHCIRQRFVSSGALYRWEFERHGNSFEIALEGTFIANDAGLIVRAALDSVGLAYVLESHVREHLAAGRLANMLDAWLPPFPGFYRYYPSRLQVPPKLRVFIDFLRERLA